MILPGNRFWCDRIPPAPPTRSPPPAVTPGWDSPSATPSTPAMRDAVEILNRNDSWYPAIESDGGIRDGAWVAEATGTGRHGRLAGPDPADPAQRTPPPRCAAEVRRLRRAADHRDSSPTPRPVWSPASSPGSNCATASTPGWRTGSAKPRPLGWPTCPATGPTPTPHGLKSCSPRSDLVGLDPTDRLHRTPRTGHAVRSKPSATGCCTSPPASPAAPDKSDSGSTPPGGGPPPSPKDGNDSEPPSHNHLPQSAPTSRAVDSHRAGRLATSLAASGGWPENAAF